MATWHQAADPLLASDIAALAGTVSRHVHACAPGEDLGAAMAAAVAATAAPAGASGSRVATLVVPHDLSWERMEQPANGSSLPASILLNRAAAAAGIAGSAPTVLAPAAQQFVRDAAAALKACPRGKAALYLGGRAALAEGEAGRRGGALGTAAGQSMHASCPCSLPPNPLRCPATQPLCRRRTAELRPHRGGHGRGAAVRERVCAGGPGRGAAQPAAPALLPAGALCCCARVRGDLLLFGCCLAAATAAAGLALAGRTGCRSQR